MQLGIRDQMSEVSKNKAVPVSNQQRIPCNFYLHQIWEKYQCQGLFARGPGIPAGRHL